jgi:hypothetical protein
MADEVTVKEPVEIQYREFYDWPRMFVASLDGTDYFFDGSFDDQIDEYPEMYQVFLMPHLTTEQRTGSWIDLRKCALRHLGSVKVVDMHFDPARRHCVEADDIRQFSHRSSFGRTGTE